MCRVARLFFAMLFIVTACLHSVDIAAAAVPQIVFFAPTSENNTYWPRVFELLKTVGEDLGVDVKCHEFDVADRFAKSIDGIRILKKKPTPDGAIFSVAFGQTAPLLETAAALDIPVFIQGPLFPSEMPAIGYSPRKKFPEWIGYFYEDEAAKGYLLGKTLLSAAHSAKAFTADGHIHVVGVGGDHTWFGSRLRRQGLERAVNADPKAQLLQVVPTKWSPSEGKAVTASLLNRYPEASVIWAASDQLGIGAARAAANAGKVPGETCFVGGLDLSRNGLRHVKEGRLVATVAGGILTYAEILIYLHDYLQGIDFADDAGTEISVPIYTATTADAVFFLKLFDAYPAIDFRKFSKVHNKTLTRYDFSLERIAQEAGMSFLPGE
ncbi:MAG: ABC transporter substrate-binding protein [Thermodesulfobacteriota bacterium]|nr:ABC transporter substrate-binding protein [Thermodesulfobacteriota bacterium]